MKKIIEHMTHVVGADYVNTLSPARLSAVELLSTIAGIQLSPTRQDAIFTYLQIIKHEDTQLASLQALTKQVILIPMINSRPSIIWDMMIYQTISQIQLTALPTTVKNINRSLLMVPDIEGCKQLTAMLTLVSIDIARSSRRGAGNVVLLSQEWCSMLYPLHQFDVTERQMVDLVEPTIIGRFLGYTVVVVPNMEGIYVGYTGPVVSKNLGQVDASMYIIPHVDPMDSQNNSVTFCVPYESIRYRKIIMENSNGST